MGTTGSWGQHQRGSFLVSRISGCNNARAPTDARAFSVQTASGGGSDLADQVQNLPGSRRLPAHLAGHTSPGWEATYWAAQLRSSSERRGRCQIMDLSSAGLAFRVHHEGATRGPGRLLRSSLRVAGDQRRSGSLADRPKIMIFLMVSGRIGPKPLLLLKWVSVKRVDYRRPASGTRGWSQPCRPVRSDTRR